MSYGLLLADCHAGVKSDSDIFLESFSKIFSKFIPEVISTLPEDESIYVFILGDLFENRNSTNSKTLNIVLESIKSFCLLYPYVKLIVFPGNHDLYYRNTRNITALKILDDLKIPNISVIYDIFAIEIDGKEVVICPWLVNKEEAEDLFKLKGDVCLCHAEINGFEMVSGIKEMNGLSPDRFESNFKVTFSGHFHLRNESGKIIYVGNPYQTKWSDVNNTKGLYLLNFEDLSYSFIENKHSPTFRKIYLSGIKKGLINLKEVIPNNFISLVLDSEIESIKLDKLNTIIASLQPYSFTVEDAQKEFSLVSRGDIDINSKPMEVLAEYISSLTLPKNIEQEVIRRKFEELYNIVERA